MSNANPITVTIGDRLYTATDVTISGLSITINGLRAVDPEPVARFAPGSHEGLAYAIAVKAICDACMYWRDDPCGPAEHCFGCLQNGGRKQKFIPKGPAIYL